MIAAVLEALVGVEPDAETVEAALETIPAGNLADALREFVRVHGPLALPVLRQSLHGRPEWAAAAAAALGALPTPEVADLLTEVAGTSAKTVRTEVRRALYRLRQAGVIPAPPAPAPPPRTRPEPQEAWASAIDGTGTRGVWLVVREPLGTHTLLAAAVSDLAGIVESSSGPIAKRRLAARLRALQQDSPLPWVAVPPGWALELLAQACRRTRAAGRPPPGELERSLAALPVPEPGPEPPIAGRADVLALAREPTLIERGAELLGARELAGWFLDPATVSADALELLQHRDSPLVVSDRVRAERQAALVDRVADTQFTADARSLWQARLLEQGFVLAALDRPSEAALAVASARALGDPDTPARHLPFVRALVLRSLEVAGEVALGRLPAGEARRQPTGPGTGSP